jgi:hypothetical protein
MNSHPSHNDFHCPECAPRLPLRNYWFWGKSIVPRDMTDEQMFFLEKLRLHHQRLHGSGIVCGLRMLQHPNASCRDRLILLEPGTAVDCCGHDVLVLEQDVIDLQDYEAFRKLLATPDGKPHTLRLCISYRECPTEEVPVLYDECACSDTRCAPNRILETYAIELQIDPKATAAKQGAIAYRRRSTILVDNPVGLAIDDTAKRLFIAKGSAVLELDATNGALKVTRDLGAPLHGLDIAKGGARLDVVGGGGGGTDPSLFVLDIGGPTGIAAAVLRQGALKGFDPLAPLFGEATEGRLALANEASGLLQIFATGIPAPVQPEKPPAGDPPFSVSAAVAGGAYDSSGKNFYVGLSGGANVARVALDQATLQSTVITLTTSPASTIAIAGLTLDKAAGPDRLIVLDTGSPARMLLADPASGLVEAMVKLDYPPIDMVISADGAIAHVLVRDAAGKAFVQSVDVLAMRAKSPRPAGAPFAVDDKSFGLRLAADGRTLYTLAPDGVAVVGVEASDCRDLLKGGDCPGCDEADCLVLATIENWQPGFAISDLPPGAIDPVADAAAKIARIDNDKDRLNLVSTQVLTNALQCLMEKPGGGGPIGPIGPAGPAGQNGHDGMPIDATLAHLCAANWAHRGELTLDQLKVDPLGIGVLVCFDKPIMAGFFDTVSFAVEFQTAVNDTSGSVGGNWLLIEPKAIVPLRMSEPCGLRVAAEGPDANGLCDGAFYLFGSPDLLARRLSQQQLRLRVRINGDLIPDKSLRGLDANHLPKIDGSGHPYWIRPPGQEPYASGDGVAGGQFEGSFILKRRG